MSALDLNRAAVLAALVLIATACSGNGPGAGDSGVDGSTGTCPTCESVCGERGCAEGVACHEATSGEVTCDPSACWPGYELDPECALDPSATCEEGDADSIATECNTLGRGCVALDGGGATCGGCLAGYVERDLACVPGEECEAANCSGQNRLCGAMGSANCGECAAGFEEVADECVAASCDACAAQHRYCDEGSGSPVCGGCLDGYFPDDLECKPFVACEDLDCAAQNRECVDAPQSYCDTVCTGGLVWDEGLGACREKQGCDVIALECEAGEMCLEGPPNQDASCIADCGVGTGWSTEAAPGGSGCFTCSDSSFAASRCESAPGVPRTGATGRVINLDGAAGGDCVCETTAGHFPDESGIPKRCDADEDGWVNVDAVAFTESQNTGAVEQGRCSVRRIRYVRLEGDDPFVTAPATIDLQSESGSAGRMARLPLYERSENDREELTAPNQSGFTSPGGGAITLAPRELNSFTKACSRATDDYNLNGLDDFEERQSDRPSGGPGQPLAGVPAVAHPFFGQYTRFSYFIELAEGWFEGADTYVIAERPRDPRHAPGRERIALAPPGDSLGDPALEVEPTGGRFWRACGRHDDVVGGDFSEEDLGVAPLEGVAMYHHSQFRCVYPHVDVTNYTSQNAVDNPARAFWTNGTSGAELSWRETSGAATTVQFALANICWPSGASYQRTAAALNASNPESREFDCVASEDRTVEPLQSNQLVWALVGYRNAQDVQDNPPSPIYLRGCINECAELGVEYCPTYDPETPSPSFICDGLAGDSYGQIECGCSEGSSGPSTSCALACTEPSTFSSPTLSPLNRDDPAHWAAQGNPGYWACLDRVLTSTEDGGSDAPVIGGSGYMLRGAIPAGLGATGVSLVSPPGDTHGYSLTSRVRREVSRFDS